MCKATASFITEIIITDPDSGGNVSLEVWKDSQSGGIFAIDSSYLEQVNNTIPNVFGNNGELIHLPE